jgi:uncharacterized protein (TIGR02246 family)
MARPQEVTRAFAGALSAAELDRATSLFADDGCFVTPDATTVHGRHGVGVILAQLIAGHAQLRVAPKSVHVAGNMALCSERWAFTYACKEVRPFTQASDSTVLLRRSDRVWKLLLVAPWHIVDADRARAVGWLSLRATSDGRPRAQMSKQAGSAGARNGARTLTDPSRSRSRENRLKPCSTKSSGVLGPGS